MPVPLQPSQVYRVSVPAVGEEALILTVDPDKYKWSPEEGVVVLVRCNRQRILVLSESGSSRLVTPHCDTCRGLDRTD